MREASPATEWAF
jgi:hypothetical protein